MKSPVAKIIIKIALSLLIIAAAFYFLIMPKLNTLVENQIALEKLSSDYRQADDKLSDLNKLNKNHADLDTIHQTVYGYMPDDPTPSTFIIGLEKMTSEISIIIDSLSTNEVKTQTSTASKSSGDSESSSTKTTTSTATSKTAAKSEKAVEFNASFKSDYNHIITFFSRMESLDRFNTIESINIGNIDPNTSNLNFQATGKIYYGK